MASSHFSLRGFLAGLQHILVMLASKIEEHLKEAPTAGALPETVVLLREEVGNAAYLLLRVRVPSDHTLSLFEVLVGKALSKGKHLEDVAAMLHRSSSSVHSAEKRLYHKLGVHNRAGLARQMLPFMDVDWECFSASPTRISSDQPNKPV